MTESTKHLVAIVVVITVGIGSVVILDQTQPNNLNVTLANKIIELLTVVVPLLLGQSALNKKAEQAATKAEEAKQAATQNTKELHTNTAMTADIKEQLEKLGP